MLITRNTSLPHFGTEYRSPFEIPAHSALDNSNNLIHCSFFCTTSAQQFTRPLYQWPTISAAPYVLSSSLLFACQCLLHHRLFRPYANMPLSQMPVVISNNQRSFSTGKHPKPSPHSKLQQSHNQGKSQELTSRNKMALEHLRTPWSNSKSAQEPLATAAKSQISYIFENRYPCRSP